MSDTDKTLTLSTGRELTIREPKAGALRGVKMLDVLQMDAMAHAAVLPRISDMTAMEFYQLGARDMMEVMSEVVGFFGPAEMELTMDPADSQSASKTPTKSLQ
jgi:hypothetical protein